MKRLLVLASVALLASCGDARTYRHFGDQLKASTGGVFGHPCSTPSTITPTRECYRLDPPARMNGVWLSEFNGGAFVATGTRVPGSNTASGAHVWLDISDAPANFPRPSDIDDVDKTYAVTIIGRRTSYPRRFGSLIVVDKLLSIREVPPPKPGDVIR